MIRTFLVIFVILFITISDLMAASTCADLLGNIATKRIKVSGKQEVFSDIEMIDLQNRKIIYQGREGFYVQTLSKKFDGYLTTMLKNELQYGGDPSLVIKDIWIMNFKNGHVVMNDGHLGFVPQGDPRELSVIVKTFLKWQKEGRAFDYKLFAEECELKLAL